LEIPCSSVFQAKIFKKTAGGDLIGIISENEKKDKKNEVVWYEP